MRLIFLCTIQRRFAGALCALATFAAAGPATAQTAAQAEQYRDLLMPVLECHVAELVAEQMQLCGRTYPAMAGRAERATRNWTARNGAAAAQRATACTQRLAAMDNRLEAEAKRASIDALRKSIQDTSAMAVRSAPEACTIMFDDIEAGRGSFEVRPRPQ